MKRLTRLIFVTFFALACTALGAISKRDINCYRGGGVFAQVVDSDEWRTTFYFMNMDSATVYVGILFLSDSGQLLSMPIEGKQAPMIEFELAPNATRTLETSGKGALKQGWAMFTTCDRPCGNPAAAMSLARVGAMAVFRQHVDGRPDSEAVVAVEMPETTERLFFDNRAGYTILPESRY